MSPSSTPIDVTVKVAMPACPTVTNQRKTPFSKTVSNGTVAGAALRPAPELLSETLLILSPITSIAPMRDYQFSATLHAMSVLIITSFHSSSSSRVCSHLSLMSL